MDFISLPPEVTSALIHSGPGAESLLAAADAWQQLGTGLEDTAPIYSSVVSSLTQTWQGSSSAAMTQAVEPYLTWLRTTAQQCQQLASSAQAAAAAFNQAQSAMVTPAQVAANRTRLAQLIATDRLGGNLAAIAATEEQYQTMWANNSAAMARYEAASAQALDLPQFSSPSAITNPAAATPASATSTAAASTPAASILQSILAPNTNATGTGLAGLLNLFSGSAQSSFGSLLNSNLVGPGLLTGTFPGSGFPINLLSYLAQASAAQSLQSVGGELGRGLSEGEAALGGAAANLSNAIGGVGSAPTAAVGVGVSLGKLTAPPAMVGLLSASKAPVQLAAAVSPLAADESGFPFLPPPMMPPVAPRKRKREGRDYDDIEIGLEIKGTFMTRPPSAG
jgi:PPE family